MASHGVEAGGFARSHDALAAPDLQFGVAAGLPPLPDLDEPTQRAASMIVVAVDVSSRGRLRLRSADPRAQAAIDPPTSPTRPTWTCWSPGFARPGRSPPASRSPG
jgi:choline dehydrogenase